MATMGATVVTVRMMPSISRMTLCGFEKKVRSLLSTAPAPLCTGIDWFMQLSFLSGGWGFLKSVPGRGSIRGRRCVQRLSQLTEYLSRVSIQLPTVKETEAQYSGSSSTSLPSVVHQS